MQRWGEMRTVGKPKVKMAAFRIWQSKFQGHTKLVGSLLSDFAARRLLLRWISIDAYQLLR